MLKKLKTLKDKKGSIIVYEKNYFKIKRVFVITGKKNVSRANHAHKNTIQLLININSKCKITLTNKTSKTINFSREGEFILCPKKTWLKIDFMKEGSIMVVCDKKYNKKDYINNIENFKKLYLK